MNKDIEEDSNEYIDPGQENYIYRCRDCALRGFAMHNFGKWGPLYFSESKYKSSTFKGHFDTCKGRVNSSQQILPHIIKKIGTKRQREEFETEIQRKECAKQGMLISFGLVEQIARQELSMAKRIPLLSWGDKLLEHGNLAKHWREKFFVKFCFHLSVVCRGIIISLLFR